MEFLMLWWDELDDLAAMVHHVAREAIGEVATLAKPPAAWGSLIGAWLRIPA